MVLGEFSLTHVVEWLRKYIYLLGMICLAVYVTCDYFFIGFTKEMMIDFLKWVEENPWPGVFAFAGVYTIATVLWVPGSILTLGAGFVFGRVFGVGIGVALGTFSVFVGAASGATLAFLLGRYIFHDIAQQWLVNYKILRAIDDVMSDKGFQIMMLLRLSPIVPFNAINYVIAGTKISFRDYVVSLIGILPGTATYVFIGATAGSMIGFSDDDNGDNDNKHSDSGKIIEPVALCIGIVLALVATFLLSYHARKRFMDIVVEAGGEVDIVSALPSRELMSPIHRESSLAYDVAKESNSSGSNKSITGRSPHSSTPRQLSYTDPDDLNVYM